VRTFQILIIIALINVVNGQHAYLGLGEIDIENNSVPILYEADFPISGLQISVTGFSFFTIGGGDAADSGFVLSGNQSGLIIGFPMMDPIPEGSGTLVNIA